MSTPTRTRSRGRAVRLTMLLVAGLLALTGCGLNFSVYSLPLPGGANLGSNPITITATFGNVLDLVPKSSVKVDDISVGEVTAVKLDPKTDQAIVTMKLRSDTKLPANTVATIRQTSLLGEKFVSLGPPTTGAAEGTLQNGAKIPYRADTDHAVDLETVFSALSLVLNNGSIDQLHTIATEINTTLSGREDATKDLLLQIKNLTGQLDTHKDDIVAAIDRLNGLAKAVRVQQGTIDNTLKELPSALDSINSQRAALVRMLTALDHLSTVGVRVIQKSKTSTIETLRQLQPVLTQLANSGSYFVRSFSVALTYPFVDQVVGRDPQVARNLQMGDYVDLDVDLQLNYKTLTQSLPGLPCTMLSALPSGTPLDQLLNLPNLCVGVNAALQKCAQNPNATNCAGIPAGVLTAICNSLSGALKTACKGLSALTATLSGKKNKGGKSGAGGLPGLPGVPGLGGLGDLGSALHSIGLGRAPTQLGAGSAGSTASTGGTAGTHASRQRVSIRQLSGDFNPALVALLTPGMVTQ